MSKLIHTNLRIVTPAQILEQIGITNNVLDQKTCVIVAPSVFSKITVSETLLNKNFKHLNIFDSNVFYNETQCVLCGSIFGAPSVSFWIESLKFMGVKEILFLGTAGVLPHAKFDFGDVLLINNAVSDEGVTKHYYECDTNELISFKTDTQFNERVVSSMEQANINCKLANAVSTDAIFMETPQKIEKYKSFNAEVIDMETSAATSVCKALGIKASVVLLITDKITEKIKQYAWEPGFKTSFVKESKKQLLNWLVQFIIPQN